MSYSRSPRAVRSMTMGTRGMRGSVGEPRVPSPTSSVRRLLASTAHVLVCLPAAAQAAWRDPRARRPRRRRRARPAGADRARASAPTRRRRLRRGDRAERPPLRAPRGPRRSTAASRAGQARGMLKRADMDTAVLDAEPEATDGRPAPRAAPGRRRAGSFPVAGRSGSAAAAMTRRPRRRRRHRRLRHAARRARGRQGRPHRARRRAPATTSSSGRRRARTTSSCTCRSRAGRARATTVAPGARVGAVGRSGNASTCHLHFEIWTAPGWYEGGAARDPKPDLERWAGSSVRGRAPSRTEHTTSQLGRQPWGADRAEGGAASRPPRVLAGRRRRCVASLASRVAAARSPDGGRPVHPRVASGEPDHESVVLWTRLAPDPLDVRRRYARRAGPVRVGGGARRGVPGRWSRSGTGDRRARLGAHRARGGRRPGAGPLVLLPLPRARA